MSEKIATPPTITVEDLLRRHNVPIHSWGIGDAKTLAQLIKEINGGDSRLVVDDEGIVRMLQTITIDISSTAPSGVTYRLVEDRQEFDDGRVRTRRGRMRGSIGEKMKSTDEHPIDAARRGLREELGITEEIPLKYLEMIDEDRESRSYPGLRSRYELHLFSGIIPSHLFIPEGYTEKNDDLSMTTFFVWEKVLN